MRKIPTLFVRDFEHDGPTWSDAVAANIRDLRKRRGWTVADLARRCQDLGGAGLTAAVVENIEHGRPRGGKRTRDVTVDELAVLAAALSVPASALMPALADGPADVGVVPLPGFGLAAVEDGLRALLTRIEEARRGQD